MRRDGTRSTRGGRGTFQLQTQEGEACAQAGMKTRVRAGAWRGKSTFSLLPLLDEKKGNQLRVECMFQV